VRRAAEGARVNLLQLRAFDAVVRTGSFTAAARRLHVSQPAVTNHVRALEEYYEVALFRRRGRGVEATALGERLATISHRLFTLEDEASELLSAHRGLARGTLSIAADGPYILIPLVAAFRARHPGVRVALSIASSRRPGSRGRHAQRTAGTTSGGRLMTTPSTTAASCDPADRKPQQTVNTLTYRI